MKKILFMLLSATTLFSSCSSDDDIISNTGDNNTKTYTVNLNVKSAGFELDKTPMKAATAVDPKLFQYILYNEDGTVYSDSVYWDAQVPPLFNDQKEIPLQLELPEGKYHLVVLYMPYYQQNPLAEYYYKIRPENFDTDYYTNGNPSHIVFNVVNVYYQVTDLTVSSSLNNNVNALTLDPMWSEITLKLKDINKAKKPSNATIMRVLYSPNYYGFSIKTKLASYGVPSAVNADITGPYAISIESDSTTMKYYPTKGVDNSMGIKIEYGTVSGNLQRWITVATQEFKLDNKLENGRRYNISGSLPDADLQNPKFGITINDLNSESIDIPFE